MFLINFNQWKCSCVGINILVILLRARYKCNHYSFCLFWESYQTSWTKCQLLHAKIYIVTHLYSDNVIYTSVIFRSCNRPVPPSLTVHRQQHDSMTICISAAEILERQWFGRHFLPRFTTKTDIQANIRHQFADWLRAWHSLETWHVQCQFGPPNIAKSCFY